MGEEKQCTRSAECVLVDGHPGSCESREAGRIGIGSTDRSPTAARVAADARARVVAPKKLIEVALPLEAINAVSGREKSIHQGHPATIHKWWARRPLAAARGVIFAQLVNDPAWKYTDVELSKPAIKGVVTRRRNELFRLIAELVQWENATNKAVLDRARAEIRNSWKETCDANRGHPDAATLFNATTLPAFHDPFAGGGILPLEAQRLGLTSNATDLNPVAVLMNKALVEYPAALAGRPPVGPMPPTQKQTRTVMAEDWTGPRGLAEDVRRYGTWMRGELLDRVGALYPTIRITREMTKGRKDLAGHENEECQVIAWLWARTVASPNPAAEGAHVPLISNLMLSSRGPVKVWLRPVVDKKHRGYTLMVESGAEPPKDFLDETVNKRGGKCLLTDSPIPFAYIRNEGREGRLGFRLLSLVVETKGGRRHLAADSLPDEILAVHSARAAKKPKLPVVELPERALGFRVQQYGIRTWDQLFFPRQLALLSTLGALLGNVHADCKKKSEQTHADAVTTILGLCCSKMAIFNNAVGRWKANENKTAPAFGSHTLSMIWDAPEGNPFVGAGGDWLGIVESAAKTIERVPAGPLAHVEQRDAADPSPLGTSTFVVSTDPPYYDNVAYADLSDFAYYWLRQFLRQQHSELLATISTPKDKELIADPFRRGGPGAAKIFFMSQMSSALRALATETSPAVPITIYYAFKQTEADDDGDELADGDEENTSGSSGWETFLEAVVAAGLAVTATWPMRTERRTRMRGQNSNALASSIVLTCRPRSVDADTVSRRDFLRELSARLPAALTEMTEDPEAAIAPVDLAQACIGPGMAIYSKYGAVLEADGSPMSVHNALLHINKAADEFFAHAEGDLDADSRFCIGWFEQRGFDEGLFGDADVLARAKGTSVDGVKEAGVIAAGKGKVRLLKIKDLPKNWDPTEDTRTPTWEALHHMCRALAESEGDAGALLAKMQGRQEAIRQLAYRLYTLCERNGWAEHARPYNELIASWPEIVKASQQTAPRGQIDLV